MEFQRSFTRKAVTDERKPRVLNIMDIARGGAARLIQKTPEYSPSLKLDWILR